MKERAFCRLLKLLKLARLRWTARLIRVSQEPQTQEDNVMAHPVLGLFNLGGGEIILILALLLILLFFVLSLGRSN
jgi:hypothetical protein